MKTLTVMPPLSKIPFLGQKNIEANRLLPEDKPAHNWYRFVLSYPPHLVRHYLEKFNLDKSGYILDPFCGTGTTIVECKKAGINSIGFEASPMACFASSVKVTWDLDPEGLMINSKLIAEKAYELFYRQGIEDDLNFLDPQLPLFSKSLSNCVPQDQLYTLPEETFSLLLTNSISPIPLHKVIVLLDCINKYSDPKYTKHQKLAIAKALISTIGNLYFGPEVGVGKIKIDVPVVNSWMNVIQEIVNDLKCLVERSNRVTDIRQIDSRYLLNVLEPQSVDAVITSPPYPNEKDYTRTTRLESVLLGFIRNRVDLRNVKQSLMRSNTRNVYKGDDDDFWVIDNKDIEIIASEIERRRIEMNKNSGFEKLYAKVTRLYFGGLTRHLSELKKILRPGAHLAYVVGDQQSYLQVMIRTGNILADIAQNLGYKVESIDLFRTRRSTVTKEDLREEVVHLRWNP